MDVQPVENFFDLKVSPEGSVNLLRFAKLSRRVFLAGILVSALLMGHGIFQAIYMDRLSGIQDWQFKAETIIRPIYLILVSLMFLYQLYCYLSFGRSARQAIELQNADLFNLSFKWLVRHAITTVTIIVVELFLSIFSMYVSIHMVMKYPTQ